METLVTDERSNTPFQILPPDNTGMILVLPTKKKPGKNAGLFFRPQVPVN